MAAGQGSRFGSDLPKQYHHIAGQSILEHSLNQLAGSDYIDECQLVVAAHDARATQLKCSLPVRLCVGGAERWQSVQAGVDAITQAGAHADDLILIHDAARPAVPVMDIDAVIGAAIEQPYGAILATPVADTLKQVVDTVKHPSSRLIIDHTVDRSNLWQAQTPQVFRLGYLQQVLSYIASQGIAITDEASGFEVLGYPIAIVHGSRQNIKLTYPEDLPLLAALINIQSR